MCAKKDVLSVAGFTNLATDVSSAAPATILTDARAGFFPGLYATSQGATSTMLYFNLLSIGNIDFESLTTLQKLIQGLASTGQGGYFIYPQGVSVSTLQQFKSLDALDFNLLLQTTGSGGYAFTDFGAQTIASVVFGQRDAIPDQAIAPGAPAAGLAVNATYGDAANAANATYDNVAPAADVAFLKVVYRKHTNFSMEDIELTHTKNTDSREEITASICKNGVITDIVQLNSNDDIVYAKKHSQELMQKLEDVGIKIIMDEKGNVGLNLDQLNSNLQDYVTRLLITADGKFFHYNSRPIVYDVTSTTGEAGYSLSGLDRAQEREQRLVQRQGQAPAPVQEQAPSQEQKKVQFQKQEQSQGRVR